MFRFLPLLFLALPAFALESREISAPGPEGALRGTLTLPEEVRAAALIIPGSGPTDRDGNGPLVQSDGYRMLAEALAGHGIAAARIDKRGMFGSAGAGDANAVSMAAYAADTRAWAGALLAEPDLGPAGCVWLIGHSEGGVVAVSAVLEDPKPFCGVVLLATPGRKLGWTLRNQFAANIPDRGHREAAIAAVRELEAGRKVDPMDLPVLLRPMFGARLQPYLRDVLGIEPAERLGRYSGPALILSAAEDVQLSPEDHAALAAARPDASARVLPGTNHMLKPVPPGDRQANFAAYRDRGLPLAPGVAETVAAFILTGTLPPAPAPQSPPPPAPAR